MSDINIEKDKKEIKILRATKETLRKECANLTAKQVILVCDYNNRSKEYATLVEKTGKLRDKKTEFDAEVSETKSVLENARVDLDKRNTELARGEKESQFIRAELLEERSRLGKFAAELDARKGANKEKANELKTKEGKAKKTAGELAQTNNTIDSRLADLLEVKRVFEADRKKYKESVIVENERIRSIKAQANADRAECEKLKGQMQTLHGQTKEQVSKASEAASRAEAQLKNVDAMEADVKRRLHDVDIKEQETEIDKLRVMKLAKDKGVTENLKKMKKELEK